MTALLLDEMFSPRLADQLRNQGLDATAVLEVPELVEESDAQILEYATSHNQILVTANISDFVAISSDWANLSRRHAGLILVSAKTFPRNSSRQSAMAAALVARYKADRWPAAGQFGFL